MLKVNNLIGVGAARIPNKYSDLIVAQSNLRYANGTTSYTDDIGRGVILTNGAQVTNERIVLDGTNDYGYYSDSSVADFDFNSSDDFTIEIFCKPEIDREFQWLLQVKPVAEMSTSTSNWRFAIDRNNSRLFYAAGSGSTIYSAAFANMYNGDVHHFVVSRVSGVLYFGADGKILSSSAYAVAGPTNSLRRLAIGFFRTSDYLHNFKGQVASYRIHKGVGLYTEDYRVPNVGDYKFPAI